MTHLHPDTDFLTDYAAGSLADSHALCVAAHLEHCPNCASEVEKLTSVGGAMFSTLAIQSSDASQTEEFRIDDALIEETLEKAVGSENQTSADNVQNTQLPASAAPVTDSHAGLPVAFRTLAPGGLENLAWKTFGKNLSVADIDKIDDKREVALHRLEPGAAVAHHDHRGREITVVLSGSFSDRNGQYYPGDFIVKEPGEQHQPTATENTPCVCLSVTDAPVRFTGMLTRLLNPVLAYRHPR